MHSRLPLARLDALDAISRLPLEFICRPEVKDELDEGPAQGYQLITRPG